MAYMINDAVDFMCGSTGAGKGLDVGGGLSNAEGSDEHDKEHLKDIQAPPLVTKAHLS